MWHNRTPGSFVSGLNDEELERVRRAFVELADPASGLLQGNQVGLLIARLELRGPPPAPPVALEEVNALVAERRETG